jgi:hypothetical protein
MPQPDLQAALAASLKGTTAARSDAEAAGLGSWASVDIVSAGVDPPAPPCIGGLLYVGKRHVLSGPTESCKTWLALILAKAEMEFGRPVAWIDVDGMGPGDLLERLRALGVPDELTSRAFLYKEPDERVDHALPDLTAEMRERGVRLCVVDAFNSFLRMHGLDPNKTPDVDACYAEVVDPIRRTGAGVALIDHVVKNDESRGVYAYGSERKVSAAHVHIGFRQAGAALTRGGTGRARLTTHKDRPAYLPRSLGTLELESDGDAIAYSFRPGVSHADGKFRPTGLMQKVSDHLEVNPQATKTEVEQADLGQQKHVRTAMVRLVEEGYVIETDGPRGAKNLAVAQPYTEADDPILNPDPDVGTTSSRPRHDLVVSLISTQPFDLVTSSSLMDDEDERQGATSSSDGPRPRHGTIEDELESEVSDESQQEPLALDADGGPRAADAHEARACSHPPDQRASEALGGICLGCWATPEQIAEGTA